MMDPLLLLLRDLYSQLGEATARIAQLEAAARAQAQPMGCRQNAIGVEHVPDCNGLCTTMPVVA